MANEEQLALLKQGVAVWNRWRENNPDAQINLDKAEFGGADLPKVNFKDAILCYADFRRSNLKGADFRRADLTGAHFRIANLSNAYLGVANLSTTYLNGANLTGANLREAILRDANLIGTNLTETFLVGTHFQGSNVGQSLFISVDLSKTSGLEDVNHIGPSSISIDTIQLSKGNIPVSFLRGCGFSDVDIEYAKLANPSLNNEAINEILYKMYDLRASRSFQISPLFISYSHSDAEFVDRLENYLNTNGIRFWRDIHDAKAGRLETQIDRAIRLNPTILLIISERALKSDWVEHEVRLARELEKRIGRDVLCPVALDESWKNSPWPKRVMEQVMEYNILDFSDWRDDSKFGKTFNKLIDGLELFYKG